jgi:zinc finger protein
LGDFGCTYNLKVVNDFHISRNIVKSEFGTIKVPELDLEIPPMTQKGSINTIEGILMKTIEGVSEMQEERRKYDPATAAKIDAYIAKLEEYRQGKHYPFTMILDDPSGNSFIQNPSAPSKDPYMVLDSYRRSIADFEFMGYSSEQAVAETGVGMERVPVQLKQATTTDAEQKALMEKASAYAVRDPEITAQYMDFTKPLDENQAASQPGDEDDVKKSVMRFETDCYSCSAKGYSQMCVSSIPFFKEIIIMAFACDACGYKNTEIKTGGGIGAKA